MLKGIPSRIGSDLLKVLADMGHGDLLVIADDFYPPISKTPGGISIQAKGNSAPEMIDAILQLFPLDSEYCAHPVEYMVPDRDANISMDRPKVWEDAVAAVIGGASLAGGRGAISGTLLGTILMVLINNAGVQFGLNTHVLEITSGVLIVFAVAMDMIKNRKKA